MANLVAVITTSYKHSQFIGDAIGSVIHQSHSNWNLFVGDDNSPDDTYEAAVKAANNDPRIRITKNPENLGIVRNMNSLLTKVSPWTEFVAFLEGDDLFDENNLKAKLEIFKRYPDVQAVISSHVLIDDKGNQMPERKGRLSFLKHAPDLKKNEPITVDFAGLISMLWNPIKSFGSVMIRKGELNKYLPLFSPDGSTMFWPLDYFSWLRIFPGQKIYVMDKPLLRYRVHSANFSWTANSAKMLEQTGKIMDWFLKNRRNTRFETNAIKFVQTYTEAFLLLSAGKKFGALWRLIQTFKYSLFWQPLNRFKLFLRCIFPLERFIKNA